MIRLPMPPVDFLATVAKLALATVGTEEQPRGSNDGPEVQGWLYRCGITKPSPWCAAWASTMHANAAEACEMLNPCPMTAKALRLWSRSPAKAQRLKAACLANPKLVKRGMLFVEDHGGDTGHCGIVLGVDADGMTVRSVEANTVPAGTRSRTGYGVFVQSFRLDDQRLLGFLDFGGRP